MSILRYCKAEDWGSDTHLSEVLLKKNKEMHNPSFSCDKYLGARVGIISKYLEGASIIMWNAETCKKLSGNLGKLYYCWWVSGHVFETVPGEQEIKSKCCFLNYHSSQKVKSWEGQ